LSTRSLITREAAYRSGHLAVHMIVQHAVRLRAVSPVHIFRIAIEAQS